MKEERQAESKKEIHHSRGETQKQKGKDGEMLTGKKLIYLQYQSMHEAFHLWTHIIKNCGVQSESI